MKTFLHSNSADREAAFTKIELLVIIMVVAIFGSMVASATRGAQNQVKIAQCAGNLRQFALSHLLYANDNSDKLPVQSVTSGSNWPWDFAWAVGNTLNQYGTPPRAMYCPGTAPRFQPADNAALYQFAAGSFHVIGYTPTLLGTSLIASNLNSSTIPGPVNVGPAIVPPPLPAARVLIADANLTSGGGNYVSIAGGFNKTHLCPHLNGTVPAGGNVAMLDGHVQWRPFGQMQARTTGGIVPTFLY